MQDNTPATTPKLSRRAFGVGAVVAGTTAMSSAYAESAAVFTDQITGEPIDPRLDPQVRPIAVEAGRGPGLPAALGPKRAAFDRIFAELGGAPASVQAAESSVISSPGGKIPVRIYRPDSGRLPAIVYTHGGGFEKGSLDSHDAPLRLLARAANAVIVAVDYRLAPEHKFPAQTDDAFAALKWTAANAERLNIDPVRIAVAGDSVGGNLAAVSAIRTRDEGGPPVAFQLLFYPVTDVTLQTESWRRFARGPWLNRDYELNALNAQYLPAGQDPADPRVSPLRAAAGNLPPAFVADAEFDGYRDEGQAYAAGLRAAGVDGVGKVYPGMVHDFFLMTGKIDASRTLIADAADALRRGFAVRAASP